MGTGGAGGSGGSGGPGGQGGDATGGGGGGTGGGGGVCNDPAPGEPNDTEATAFFLGLISDDDDDGGTFNGRIVDAADVDWYTYNGVDTFGYEVDPTREFAAGSMRICKFATCVNGSQIAVNCLGTATPATSPSGLPGCCDIKTFSIDVDCASSDDDTRVYIRIDQPAASCLAYSVNYHY